MRDQKLLDSAPDSEETSGLSSEGTARHARGKRHAGRDSVPDWAPLAVLGVLVSLGLLGGLGVVPLPGIAASPGASAAGATPPKTSGQTAVRAATSGIAAPSASADAERVSVSHIVVAHKGVQLGAHLHLTRTREEAKQRAGEALARARKGEDFGKLVAEYSDEPGSAARNGSAGRFGRKHAIPGFSEAAFALKVGGISDVVESSLGFHVILRTE
jgi:peptidyl-prolyl cis-trans isomerase NIMA-interacting 1